MSRSLDESRYANRQFRSSSDPWHTNFSIPYDQPMNVAQHQSSYEYPLTVPYLSHGRMPSCSMQLPNSSMPDVTLFSNNYPYVSCPSRLPDKSRYQKPELGSTTSCYALSTLTESRPFVVEHVGRPQALVPTLSSPPVQRGISQHCGGANPDCGNACVENCSGMPTTDLSKASCSSDSTDLVASSVDTSPVASGSDSKTDIITPPSGMDTAVTTSAGAITPRPKCGRAKTNAELKRQLMERREQRLRDMLENSCESTATSHTCADVVSASACKPTEVMVSYCSAVLERFVKNWQ